MVAFLPANHVQLTDQNWVGLVLGASVLPSGNPSAVLKNRLDLAFELFKNNKIGSILVSGDNRQENYNEPQVMQNYLQKKGIPIKNILQDPLGIRTFDSCNRAKTIFKLSKVVIISQAFHLPRSNFLCSQLGLELTIAQAPNPSQEVNIFGILRELPACYLSLKEILVG